MPIELNNLGVQLDIPVELNNASSEISQLVYNNQKLRRKLHTCYFIGAAAVIIGALVYFNNQSFTDHENIDTDQ